MRVTHLLREKENLESRRQELEQQLSAINVHLIEVQSEYGTIFNKRCTLLNLPIEVTCLIFTYALLERVVDEEDSDSDTSSEEDADPLVEVVVSHVCRKWRTISLGYQKLWCCFWYNGPESTRSQVDRFDAYMERSGTQPLHLWFEFRDENAKIDHHPLFQRAINFVNRWEHVTVFSESDNELLTQLRLLVDAKAPMLQYFSLYIDASCEDHDDERPVTSLETTIFKGGAPKLTFVLLDSSIGLTMPPLTNLTTLRIEKGDMSMLHILECTTLIELLSLPSLLDVSLVGEMFYPPDDSLPNFEMPRLKRFRICEISDFWGILQRIRAPKLHTLVIYGCDFLSSAPAVIEAQKPYSFPALSKLWLLETTAEEEVAKYLVKMTSSITEAFITHDLIDMSFLATITNHLSQFKVWPRLKTLTCNIEGFTDTEAYVNFSRTRTKGALCWRLHNELTTYWKAEWPDQVEVIKECTRLEEVEEDFSAVAELFWPEDMDFPPFYVPEEDDHFAIESYY
ncbi:hypothetical protein CPB83DRAFT_350529 [Crepidotus variabilis]|uniref:F-box domain-containing protein n=1 Tax=Crepidotus variabilis TaxID=179855 RepID=A0A9P6JPW7_9AGAR|nr:hypothetical protein CPB83DRAFT_350529 [Crepidotus variabilis]